MNFLAKNANTVLKLSSLSAAKKMSSVPVAGVKIFGNSFPVSASVEVETGPHPPLQIARPVQPPRAAHAIHESPAQLPAIHFLTLDFVLFLTIQITS